jgi:hypothetical protein
VPTQGARSHDENADDGEKPMTAVSRLSIQHQTPEERAASGRKARVRVPRSSHGEWSPDAAGRDPLGILALQGLTRVPELVPIRYERMAENDFAFYRGAAAVMAADLAPMARTGLTVQLCGDAHLVNFGGFASPERALLFDVNDFDETLPGPFEWDLKRLAASLEIAGRSRDFTRPQRAGIVAQASHQYRQAMREFAKMGTLQLWYSRLDVDGVIARWGAAGGEEVLKRLQKSVTKAESKDHLKAFTKLTHVVDGELVFQSDPPLLVPVEELYPESLASEMVETIHRSLRSYRKTLQGDRRHLTERFRFLHMARKVVGVGSVGTRCWVALLVSRDNDDPIFLQVKEAEASVLEAFLGRSQYENHGQRVVEGQRMMQAASDILLGWERNLGMDTGRPRDFYVRQLWDWKASVDVDSMPPTVLGLYGEICAWTLARAHARSGDAIAIAAYLGQGDVMDQALSSFAAAYADQNEADHAALTAAIASGAVNAAEPAPAPAH